MFVLLLPVDFPDECEGTHADPAVPEKRCRTEDKCFWTEWQQEEESYGTEHTKAVGLG